jgi:hypothetical protein
LDCCANGCEQYPQQEMEMVGKHMIRLAKHMIRLEASSQREQFFSLLTWIFFIGDAGMTYSVEQHMQA